MGSSLQTHRLHELFSSSLHMICSLALFLAVASLVRADHTVDKSHKMASSIFGEALNHSDLDAKMNRDRTSFCLGTKAVVLLGRLVASSVGHRWIFQNLVGSSASWRTLWTFSKSGSCQLCHPLETACTAPRQHLNSGNFVKQSSFNSIIFEGLLGSISWPSRPIFTGFPSFQGLERCCTLVKGRS